MHSKTFTRYKIFKPIAFEVVQGHPLKTPLCIGFITVFDDGNPVYAHYTIQEVCEVLNMPWQYAVVDEDEYKLNSYMLN